MHRYFTESNALNQPASDHDIITLEHRLSLNLPDDLESFYKISDGAEGSIGEYNYLAIYPVREVLLLLGSQTAIVGLPPERKAFAFGGDGGDELYFYIVGDAGWSIYMLPKIDLSWNNAVFMGNGFSDFLQACYDYRP